VGGWPASRPTSLPDPGAAEFAVLVDDAAHGRGIGTLLLVRRMARHPTGLDTDAAGIEEPAERAITYRATRDGGGWQPPDLAAELLACFGVPVLAGRVADSAPAAVAAADALGYPAVLKAADRNWSTRATSAAWNWSPGWSTTRCSARW
jgi:acyl-CoA synthetase (NDP forming)